MPPLRLSQPECSSLRKISERPRFACELPDDHAEKFVNYGLASREAMLLTITPRGQVELLANGFRLSLRMREHYDEGEAWGRRFTFWRKSA